MHDFHLLHSELTLRDELGIHGWETGRRDHISSNVGSFIHTLEVSGEEGVGSEVNHIDALDLLHVVSHVEVRIGNLLQQRKEKKK